MKLCGHRACLWSQLAELTDGGGQQGILGHYGVVRLAGCVCRTVLVHGGDSALDCSQVVEMAIFCKRQQFIREFGRCIFFIRLFSLVPFIILGRAIYNNKERLPWSILIVYRGVPPEGGLVGERPSAGVAHEWPLPGVDAAVALQGVELGELLAALVTAVGTLPCMDFNMLVK